MPPTRPGRAQGGSKAGLLIAELRVLGRGSDEADHKQRYETRDTAVFSLLGDPAAVTVWLDGVPSYLHQFPSVRWYARGDKYGQQSLTFPVTVEIVRLGDEIRARCL